MFTLKVNTENPALVPGVWWYTKTGVWTVNAAVGSSDDSWKRNSLCSFDQHRHNWLTGICVWRSSGLTWRESMDVNDQHVGLFVFPETGSILVCRWRPNQKTVQRQTKRSGPTNSHAVIHLRYSGCEADSGSAQSTSDCPAANSRC